MEQPPAAAPGWTECANKAGQRNHVILTVDHSRAGGSRKAVRGQVWESGHHGVKAGEAQVLAAELGTVTGPLERASQCAQGSSWP